MNQTGDEILTLDEVAVYLKAGKKTVYRLAQQGEIPGFKLRAIALTRHAPV